MATARRHAESRGQQRPRKLPPGRTNCPGSLRVSTFAAHDTPGLRRRSVGNSVPRMCTTEQGAVPMLCDLRSRPLPACTLWPLLPPPRGARFFFLTTIFRVQGQISQISSKSYGLSRQSSILLNSG